MIKKTQGVKSIELLETVVLMTAKSALEVKQ